MKSLHNYNQLPVTGSIAWSARRRYSIYSEADFEVFRPAGGDTLHRWGEIWRGGGDLPKVPPPRQISPTSVQRLGYRTLKTEIFTEIW